MVSKRGRPNRPNPQGWVGDALKGANAGAVGVWLMDRVGWFLYRREASAALRREKSARVAGKDAAHVAAGKAARAFGITLSPSEPHPAGLVVHYALGVVPGRSTHRFGTG